MKSMGQKIRALRMALGLTQETLAERIDITTRTLQRYEADEYTPDARTLARLAAYFDVSSDYLLDLLDYDAQDRVEAHKLSRNGKYSKLYAHFIECKDISKIDLNAAYYEISYDILKGISLQTKWVGWANPEKTQEIRRISPVNPTVSYNLYNSANKRPMIINNEYDVRVFRMFGGLALVKTDICKIYLPEYCQDFIRDKGEIYSYR